MSTFLMAVAQDMTAQLMAATSDEFFVLDYSVNMSDDFTEYWQHTFAIMKHNEGHFPELVHEFMRYEFAECLPYWRKAYALIQERNLRNDDWIALAYQLRDMKERNFDPTRQDQVLFRRNYFKFVKNEQPDLMFNFRNTILYPDYYSRFQGCSLNWEIYYTGIR